MKKVLSVLLALVIIVAAVPLGAFEFKAEAAVTCPTMDSENAMAFIGFITNNGRLTEQEIKDSDAYKIITGKYNESDHFERVNSLLIEIMQSSERMANQADANKKYYNNLIIKYLSKNVPDSVLVGLTDVEKSEKMNYRLMIFLDAFEDTLSDLKDLTELGIELPPILDGISSAYDRVTKAEEFVNYLFAATSAFCSVYNSEYAGRYGYFNCYLSNRRSYNSNTDEIFQIIMSYNRMAFGENNFMAGLLDMFSFITNKDSFTNHFDVLDRWAEYTYQLERYVASFYDDVVIEGDNETNNTVNVTSASFAASKFTMFSNYILINPVNVYPYNATNKTITYSSGNTSIATVDSSGKITPKSPGTVTIYGKVDGVTATCSITILPFYADRVNNNYTITGYCGSGGNVTIPSSVSDGKVVGIGDSAFYNCNKITSITIPTTITSIGTAAFYHCTKLNNVTIPNSVTSIGEHAFNGCTTFSKVVVPNSVKSIGYAAFNGCNKLSSITLPFVGKSKTENKYIGHIFGSNSFHYNADYVPSSLKTVVLTSMCEEISYYAFYNCQYIKNISIPNTVTFIGGSAFSCCHSLESVVIPKGVSYIGSYTFHECKNLLSVTIPDSVTSIGERAFEDCISLTKITIPNSVTSIEARIFNGCTKLSNVQLGNNITSISVGMFSDCTSLESIIIPDSVISIDNNAFYNCVKLKNLIIPDSVTSIGESAFSGCSNLSSVKLSKNISSINARTFYYCENLLSIDIPNNVTFIGDSAFSDCKKLKSVKLSSNIKKIGAKAFYRCLVLSDISLPEGVTYIGDFSFAYTDFSGKKLPSNLTYLGEGAFYLDSALTEITIPDSIKRIPNETFSECGNLISVTLPENIEYIGKEAFYRCFNLENINIPKYFIENPGYVGLNAFFQCDKLEFGHSFHLCEVDGGYETSTFYGYGGTVVIPEKMFGRTIIGIGSYTFEESGIQEIILPDTITYIDDYAFYFNWDLDEIIIPKSVTRIGDDAFNRSGVTTFYYEGTAEEWNKIDIGFCEWGHELTPECVIFLDCSGHDWQDYKIVTEGDCTTDRVVTQRCTECHQTQTVTTTAHGHTNQTKYNSTNHWNECSTCGVKSIETAHVITETVTESGTTSSCDCGYSIFTANATDSDENINVSAGEGAFVVGTEIIFDYISAAHEQFEQVKDVINEISKKFIAYDITPSKPLNEGKNAQISFVIPEDFGSDVAIYYVDTENGVYERLETTVKDGKAYAMVNHFSVYVLVDETLGETQPDQNFKFAGASLTLTDNISVNYKVSKDAVADYSNLYAKFNFGDKVYTIKNYTVSGEYYVFTFDNIAPNQLNQTIYATLYGTKDGVEFESTQVNYSVATYCYNMLDKCADNKYAEFRTLLVDLLNYGAQSQTYTGYNTDNLANASLTDTQKAWGTSSTPTLKTVQKLDFETIENPSVLWRGGGLVLDDSVTMRFIIQTDNIENLTVKMTTDNKTYTVRASSFKSMGENLYYVYFNNLNASQMSETVYLTVYNGEEAVSNTLRYSIESYAYAKVGGSDANLSDLLVAMMKYGNAAYNYVN